MKATHLESFQFCQVCHQEHPALESVQQGGDDTSIEIFIFTVKSTGSVQRLAAALRLCYIH